MARPTKRTHAPNPVSQRTGLKAENEANVYLVDGLKALKKGDERGALRSFTEALKRDPLHPEVMRRQAVILGRHEKFDAAIELMQAALMQQPDDADGYFLVASWYSRLGYKRLAAAALHRCVQLRPEKDAPRRYLAGLYGNMGFEDQSKFWAKKAINTNAFEVREARQECRMTVLALFTYASGSVKVNQKNFSVHTAEGHNNLSSTFDPEHIKVVRMYVDTLDRQPQVLKEVPPADLIYNSITDPERCEHALGLAQHVCDQLDLPVTNPPAQVLAASREGNYARIGQQEKIVFPKSVRLDDVAGPCRDLIENAVAHEGFELPVIIRLAGYQGGRFMQKVEDPGAHDFQELDRILEKHPQTVYLIQYHEVGYRDERIPDHVLYPKYRAFMVGGKLYPAHFRLELDNFNVHRVRTFEDYPWLRDEEQRYFRDPSAYFAPGLWESLQETASQIGLDYFGVDFAPTPDGQRIIVFEANASMRSRANDFPADHYVYHAYRAIKQAVHQHFTAVAGVAPWDYVLPPGKKDA